MTSSRTLPDGGTGSSAALAVVAAAVSLGGLVFVVCKAVVVPLTYDEAAAYLRYISTDLASVVSFAVATNHLLQTALTRVFHGVAGDSELVLRLPGIIGYVLYSWFAYLIAAGLRHRTIALAGFILLHLNLYLLDFFAMSRGYGLSLGLLMGAVHFLVRSLAERDPGSRRRQVAWSLGLAGGAVLANFVMLNVYLSIVAVAVVSVAVSGMVGRTSAATATEQPFRTWRWPWALAGLAAAAFAAAVFSQDAGLSEKLYEPVRVGIAGLEEAELDAVRVGRLTLRGRWTPIARRGTGWEDDSVTHVCGLRIEVPHALVPRIGLIDVAMGGRLYSYPSLPSGDWRSFEAGRVRVLESTPALSLGRPWVAGFQPIINWAGNRRHLQTLAEHTGVFLLLLAASGWALERLGRLAVHAGIGAAGDWRPIRASLVWVAAFAAPPLYVLKRHGELYYGGTTGLIQDTFRSVIEKSFYGRFYHDLQVEIVLAAIAGSLGVAAGVIFLHARRGTLARMAPLLGVASLILLVSAAVVAQRALFDTPYLFGRTALLYVPLCVLFVTLLSDGVADLGRPPGTAAAVMLSVILLLSGYHAWTTANVSSMLEWRGDADTKAMVADLEKAVTRGGAAPPRLSLGVEPSHFPVAVFYTARSRVTDITIEVLPTSNHLDFAYVSVGDEHPPDRIIARYPIARTLLLSAGH